MTPVAAAPDPAATAAGLTPAADPIIADRATAPGGLAVPDDGADSCTGTVTEPANGTTVISVQGYKFGDDGGKRPAKLVGVGPDGEVEWVHQMAERFDVRWGYDVDPLQNGNLFVTAELDTEGSIYYEFDPRTQEVVWVERLAHDDTHDADLIDGGEAILIANMRNYNESTGENEDRLLVYNRTTEAVEWEWHFDDHYDPAETEENYTDDWTHVNDVDEIGEGLYLASPRNFDQTIVVNRSTGDIEMKLGEDGNLDVLDEQHNPDYLESENGTPTLLVGDSGNHRIVEYANRDSGERTDGSRASSDSSDGDLTNGTGWERTWTLEGDLRWPRDADRLPNGNTLVTDSSNDRVVEVTPEGDVVWEFYAPWLVYDAARVSVPGEYASGPTATDMNATGTYEIDGSERLHENDTRMEQCNSALQNVSGWVDGEQPTTNGTDEGAMGGTDESGENSENNENGDGDGTADGASSVTDIPGFGVLAAITGLLVALAVGRRRSR
jgi:PGF-CTERM protein